MIAILPIAIPSAYERNREMRLFFVGGIHGVGKTTLCKLLAPLIGAKHLTAGELICSASTRSKISNKIVGDVHRNQDRLILALEEKRQQSSRILLDGHYCLMAPGGGIEPIPVDTFWRIQPLALLLVTDDPRAVAERLAERDGERYALNSLRAFMQLEEAHAVLVSRTLDIPLVTVQGSSAVDDARKFLQALFI